MRKLKIKLHSLSLVRGTPTYYLPATCYLRYLHIRKQDTYLKVICQLHIRVIDISIASPLFHVSERVWYLKECTSNLILCWIRGGLHRKSGLVGVTYSVYLPGYFDGL